ncbi:hypothetical protein D5281_12410 [bacterium 1xD42-62]|uniref:Uncharacterized protein n=1 Tax=Parablautia muri TaxID=2320879 RepID=A0A9X5BGN8_9FIRM|nr:hypothetical protein [Parablautia muri]
MITLHDSLTINVLAVFICRNGISVCKDTKHPGHWKMMRGELRGEIFACLRVCGRTLMQVERGIVTDEGKI